MVSHFFNSKKFLVTIGIISLVSLMVSIYIDEWVFPHKIQGKVITRSQALEIAKKIAEKNQFNPTNFKEEINFITDFEREAFVEIEFGTNFLIQLIKNNMYQIHTWRIHYYLSATSGQIPTNDITISLTTAGVPYGFSKKIYVDESVKKQISIEQGRVLAEKKAQEDWGIIFDEYKIISSFGHALSSVKSFIKAEPKIDYTFIYKRLGTELENIPLRLKLDVTNAELSGIEHFIEVPGMFNEKYNAIKTANRKLLVIAGFFIFIFFLIGCIALVKLRKTGFIRWKPAMIVSFLLTFMAGLNAINTISFLSVEDNMYVAISAGILFLIVFWMLMSIIIAAAETLTRKAFPERILLWEAWSTKNATSSDLLMKTILSYLLAPIKLLYAIIWYFFVTQVASWWIAADPLEIPSLSNHFPFVSGAISSILAGVMEECIYRAIPIATATLLGERYGKRTIFIAIALIIQALAFGAAHTTQASVPVYAMLTLHMMTALFLGAIYIYLGLYTVILVHIEYDLLVFGLSDASTWLNQIFLILIGSIPLLIIFLQRIRRKAIVST